MRARGVGAYEDNTSYNLCDHSRLTDTRKKHGEELGHPNNDDYGGSRILSTVLGCGVERTHQTESPIAGKDLTVHSKLSSVLNHSNNIGKIPDALYAAGFAPANTPA